MEKWETLPTRKRPSTLFWALCALTTIGIFGSFFAEPLEPRRLVRLPHNADEITAKCKALKQTAGPPEDFHSRRESDRWVPGTKPVLLKNATIWVGKGRDTIHRGRILIDRGIIKSVGHSPGDFDVADVSVVDVGGAWVTPGIFDMHSHIGVYSTPGLKGASDGNSLKGVIQPWLRSLDGLNTRDAAYKLSISGGITTAMILPGSANAIGGQAFAIKLRPTAKRTPSSMLLEPPHTINDTVVDPSHPPRWRQMKHACGENPSRVYKVSRMDTYWAFRSAYEEARKIKVAQDGYCGKVEDKEWEGLGLFPESLQWEALVDVLRGRVKVHNHCYEAVDFDAMVRLTQEFGFHIAAFHHAHEAYLVPDLLKSMYSGPPAVALFAAASRYKRESYRGSEFAPQILAQNGLQVVMKSDHPELNSRYLLYEAQQAHYYGLEADLALASVISTPAEVAGYSHRLGYIKPGYDADIVVWDSHPLALGATPKQVYIDGIAQLSDPFTTEKPVTFQVPPRTPNFDDGAARTLKYDGLPPLVPEKKLDGVVLFANVSAIHTVKNQVISTQTLQSNGVAVVQAGRVICFGAQSSCAQISSSGVQKTINLRGGSLAPGLVTYGSPLGLVEIRGEGSTGDGTMFSFISEEVPQVLENEVMRAIDGLQFLGRNALLAYRAGVTIGVTAPISTGVIGGLSVAFSLGAAHKLEAGAISQNIAALHVTIAHAKWTSGSSPSVSTQIALLRKLLLGRGEGDLKGVFEKVAKGRLSLVITVENADIMATLLNLKTEVEHAYGGTVIRMTFASASEAHILAKEIGQAGVGVILSPVRPFPSTWESQRIMEGPPTRESAVSVLLAHNVTVGIGVTPDTAWDARSLRFDVGWLAIEAGGRLTERDAMAIGSLNLLRLLGVDEQHLDGDLVAYEGGNGAIFNFEAKAVAVASSKRAVVEFFGEEE